MTDTPRLAFETLTNFDASTLTASYAPINALSGTVNEGAAFKFYNSSTSLIIISYDGVLDHDFIPPGSAFIFDAQSNSAGEGGSGGYKKLGAGTVVYAKTSSNTDRLMMAIYH